jgi:hypothetical protein
MDKVNKPSKPECYTPYENPLDSILCDRYLDYESSTGVTSQFSLIYTDENPCREMEELCPVFLK